MKKFLSLFVVVIMVASTFGAFSVGAVADEPNNTVFSGGDGTSDDPYIITTAEQLALMAELVNMGDTNYERENNQYRFNHYILGNDIDLSDFGRTFNNGRGWIPIGRVYAPFAGVLDGAGHTITGLYINDTSDPWDYALFVGLFGSLGNDGAVIKNLNLSDVDITGKAWAGGVAGIIGRGSVKNSSVTGIVRGGYGAAGGIAGEITIGSIENSWTAGTVTGIYVAGGIVGIANGHNTSNPSSVINSYSLANVSSNGVAGGIVGRIGGSVAGGGVVGPGVVRPPTPPNPGAIIQNTYSAGMISGGYGVGGIAGSVSVQINWSHVMDSAALNPVVIGPETIGRVFGINNEGSYRGNPVYNVISGNYALVDMPVTDGSSYKTLDKGHNVADGVDVSRIDALSVDFWINTMGWDCEIWDFADGRLPMLRDAGNQQFTAIENTSPTITVTMPTASSIRSGNRLSNSTLSGGSIAYNGRNVAGTFAWIDDNIVANSSGSFRAVFMPNDAENYVSVVLNVPLAVTTSSPPQASRPGGGGGGSNIPPVTNPIPTPTPTPASFAHVFNFNAHIRLAIDNNIMIVDGANVIMDIAPYISEGRTMVPVHYIGRAFNFRPGQDMLWDGETRTVTLIANNIRVELVIGSKIMTINGEVFEMDVAPEITNDRTFLPISWVARAFGVAAPFWDEETRTVEFNASVR